MDLQVPRQMVAIVQSPAEDVIRRRRNSGKACPAIDVELDLVFDVSRRRIYGLRTLRRMLIASRSPTFDNAPARRRSNSALGENAGEAFLHQVHRDASERAGAAGLRGKPCGQGQHGSVTCRGDSTRR